MSVFILNLLSAQTVDSFAIKQVDSLIKISRNLTAKRDFDKAIEVNVVATEIALEKFGRESAAYGSCAFNRGRVNLHKGDYLEAEKWNLEAKDIRKKVLGTEHLDYAKSLNNLAAVYVPLGEYEKAEPLLLEAKDIRQKVLGKEHPDYANDLFSLAVLYNYMSNYKKAEPLILEAKDIQEKVLGKEHPDYARSLFALATLYMDIGNYEKAEQLFLKTKDIQEKVLGKEHPSYAKSLHNLASLYKRMGNYEKTELLLLEAKAIQERDMGTEHYDNSLNLSALAILYKDMGNYEKALPLYLEAKAIREKMLGVEHPDYASCLNNLAIVYRDMGNYEKVELFHLKAKAIREKVLGKQHPEYVKSLNNLADLYERQSRFLEAEPLLEEVLTLSQSKLLHATSFLSEIELAKYTAISQSSGDDLRAYLLARQVNEVSPGILPSLAYDHALFNKGFLLNAASRVNAPSMASPETVENNLSFKGYRRCLAAEYAKPIADRKNVAELEEKANLAEKELARSVAGYADALRQVKWQDVKATLKQANAAIEFISFKVNFPKTTDSIVYAALLLKHGEKQPIFIPLFEERSLDSLLNSKSERKADYVNTLYTLADRGAVAVEAPKKSLYEILWKPLEKELSGIKTIYFSPTGLLHRLNLDAIPVSETETLADRYILIELNSTRQLVIPTQIKNANNDAALFGGIQYEQDTTMQSNELLLVGRSRGELSFNYVDSTLRGGSWNYLAGTEREVNAIEKIMQSAGVQTILKKGCFATEESFKNIGANNAASPRILHIATHGYFFPDSKESRQSSVVNRQEESVFKMSEHPMLRSGLVMAGGNAAWQGKQTLDGREDGIFTAYEISQMNLSNTELVVLSACETGLGYIQGNEGVYGLQRAFKIAGAKYLIMSLWQVPDKQTSLLMTTFYKKWLEDKMMIPEAFHAAQKELREVGLDPYQWAGFVLVE